jgi:sortase B
MKRSTKTILTIVAALSALVCVVCCVIIFQYFRGGAITGQVGELNEQGEDAVELVPVLPTQPPEEQPSEAAPQKQESTAPDWYISVNFEALTQINPDIYAWIDIPGTPVSYAVVQSPTNDLYYNNHAVDKSYYTGGSIFSQRYNAKDFQDPVTVLYGHNRQSETMFAPVNKFADGTFFDEHPVVYIYTPEKVYEYRIFAAYPHSSEHLLLNHDFASAEEFDAYFGSISAVIDSHYREDLFPEAGDRVLTLSTCYRSNRMQRYLVQGVLEQEYTIVRK